MGELRPEVHTHGPMLPQAIDMDYSFNVCLRDLATASEFRRLIGS